MSVLPDIQKQTAALREALQHVLFAVDTMPANTSCDRLLREEKRQRVLALLAELASTTTPESERARLVSPLLDPESLADVSVLTNELERNESAHADSVHLCPLPEHRLLGNVFARPPPLEPSEQLAREWKKKDAGGPTKTAPHYLAERVSPYSVTVLETERADARRRAVPLANTSLRSGEEVPDRAGSRSQQERFRTDDGIVSSDNSSLDYYIDRVNDRSDYARTGRDPTQRGHNSGVLVRRAASPSPRRNICLYDYASVTPSFWINVWPCYGNAVCRSSKPNRVLVRGCYRYFADVVERAAEQTRCQPACPSLYTPDGCPVRELEKLMPEQHYLLFPSGGFYRRQAVPNALLWLLYKEAKHIVQCS